jgi:cbb3-type cytochrome oxidase subunit 3
MNTSLIKTVLAESNVAFLQVAALLLFIAFFMALVAWIYWPGSKSYYDKIAKDLLKGE